jgi:lycopene cyclase domain-containing protein
MAWRNLTYYAIVLPAYLPLLAAAIPRWQGYRTRYLSGWRDWLPSMLIVAALMAVLDAFSVAQGWWVFNREFFTPPYAAGVPLAELMFFVGAVFFIRFIVVAVEWARAPSWIHGPVRHRRRLLLTLSVVILIVYAYAWIDGRHPRTIVEFGFMYVLSALLLAITAAFWRRETWTAIGTALVLLFVMDSVMNSLGTFVHTAGAGTGILVLGLFPIEDIPYALSVIQLMIAAPHLLRLARRSAAASG